jgi:hypothetical protein
VAAILELDEHLNKSFKVPLSAFALFAMRNTFSSHRL